MCSVNDFTFCLRIKELTLIVVVVLRRRRSLVELERLRGARVAAAAARPRGRRAQRPRPQRARPQRPRAHAPPPVRARAARRAAQTAHVHALVDILRTLRLDHINNLIRNCYTLSIDDNSE